MTNVKNMHEFLGSDSKESRELLAETAEYMMEKSGDCHECAKELMRWVGVVLDGHHDSPMGESDGNPHWKQH